MYRATRARCADDFQLKPPVCTIPASALGGHPLGLAVELVQRRQVSLGRGHDDVGIGADTIDDAAAVLKPNRDLALRLSAARRDGD